MILFKKKTAPALSEALADRMLENIFDACQAEPNTIPLKTLISYTRYRRERFSFQKILLVVILLLFCLLPLLFLYPGVSLQLQPTDTPWLPTYRIDVDTLLPVSSVYAEVDGSPASGSCRRGEYLHRRAPRQWHTVRDCDAYQ